MKIMRKYVQLIQYFIERSLDTGTQGKESMPMEAENGVMGLHAQEYLLTQL